MEVFVSNLPESCTNRQLNEFFRQKLEDLDILTFSCQKLKNKNVAILTIHDQKNTQKFLAVHGSPGRGRTFAQGSLMYRGRQIYCKPSRNKADPLLLSALEREDAEKRQNNKENVRIGRESLRNGQLARQFDIKAVHCGLWDYSGASLVFLPYYSDYRHGSMHLGRKMLAILLDPLDDGPVLRVDMPYNIIDSIVVGTYAEPVLSVSLIQAPTFVTMREKESLGIVQDHPNVDLAVLLQNLKINPSIEHAELNFDRTRVCGLHKDHLASVGVCFVYRISLTHPGQLQGIPRTLQSTHGAPGFVNLSIRMFEVLRDFKGEMDLLQNDLQKQDKSGNLPYVVKFQVVMLAYNGFLAPKKICSLLPGIAKISEEFPETTTSEAIRKTSRSLPLPGPSTEAISFAPKTILKAIRHNAENHVFTGSVYDLAARHDHIGLVHRVYVTPTSIFLQGPELETKNRVLRKYPSGTSSFLRVSFTDEDGGPLRSDPQVSRKEIYRTRFTNVLTDMLTIAGRGFIFLGFSHSSLRAAQCWFMAPFIHEKGLIHAQEVIKNLGDFSMIRSPAKCAARIGQTFSDTTETITISPDHVITINDIERNKRVFTDGVGTISEGLLLKVWQQFAKTRKKRATLLQIRYQGAKGMLALDSTLAGNQLCLRPSMVKFEGSNDHNLEISGAAFKPLPMYLNRQFVKILEDLGVPAENFLHLQTTAIEKLLKITDSPFNCEKFLMTNMVATSAQLPLLVRMMGDIGLHFKDDPFMTSVLEIAILAQLRELKYRARIPVDESLTLYGIADETGYLEEGQVYCATRDIDGKKSVLQGSALITRSPALHPGDIQIVQAVDVPSDSPLQMLHNCVVFSQHGERDLPSKLSGGDLDGDLYNIFWNKTLWPKKLCNPADYPRPQAVDIGREVTAEDMMNFFVQFMESDQLGYICNAHLQVADQKDDGTLSSECLILAEMASTAVDFSKTGIPVDMTHFPKTFKRRLRPDFMADGPRLIIGNSTLEFVEDRPPDHHEPPDILSSLEPDIGQMRFYTSHKVLGKLYRAIDETKFLNEMQTSLKTSGNIKNGGKTLLAKVWDYVKRETALIQWTHLKDEAREIKESYEDNLVDTLYQFSQDPRGPLTELEVFSGTILGKGGRTPNKPTREANVDMKAKFDRDVAFTVSWMIRGDANEAAGGSYAAGGGGYYEEDADLAGVAIGGVNEALERSIACFAVAMEDPGRHVLNLGALKSFTYVAAAVCLKELDRFRAFSGMKDSYHAAT